MASHQYRSTIPIAVNGKRINQRLKKLAEFGINDHGGIDRSFGSAADIAARNWLKEWWQKVFQSEVKVDPVANLWIEVTGKEKLPPIVLGSHHDAVANGGKYDGSIGVLLAAEVMQTLEEAHFPMRHPMRIVSFSAEEPNPYNISTLGSRSITGVLTKKDLEMVTHDATKVKLTDTIRSLGGDVDHLAGNLLHPRDLSAFLECHIEQGRNLFDCGRSVAVVKGITGIYREKIKVIGEANHSGTTLMKDRHDALLAGSELNLALEEIILNTNQRDVVGTVGRFDVLPNAANIIPGEVDLIAEVRTTDEETLQQIIDELSSRIRVIEKGRRVRILRETILNQKSVPMDQQVQLTLKKVLTSMNEPFLEIPSMAGHDAVHMAPIAKTGMLFVPSIDGKSHCPEEETNLEDIIKAGNVLLQTVIALDKELD
ncbi:Zn-dependent hydrolase [Sporolactobacillus sp. THM7-7]|nr:Zn-dependent hydrolase [Sporolactobacillus sp. THM7-7]